MRKINALIVFALLTVLVPSFVLPGYCRQDDAALEQLKSELKKEKVSEEFIRSTEKSVQRMIASQAAIDDIRTVLLDLWHEGVKGRALKNAVASVAELVANGDNTLEAAKITSTAAHKAEAEGLGGFGVGMRVKKAVQERKAYLQSLKK